MTYIKYGKYFIGSYLVVTIISFLIIAFAQIPCACSYQEHLLPALADSFYKGLLWPYYMISVFL